MDVHGTISRQQSVSVVSRRYLESQMLGPFAQTVMLGIASMSVGSIVWAIPTLSEIRIEESGGGPDRNEYFELRGGSGESLDNLTYVVIGEGAGESGTVEMALALDGNSIPVDGVFVVAKDTFENGSGAVFAGIIPDLTLTPQQIQFGNSDNKTHLLVGGFTGSVDDDLDTNDDGELDWEPWTIVLDAVGFVEEPNPPTSTELEYATYLGFPAVGPDGTFVPGHLFRDESQDNRWRIGEFSLHSPNATDTPGGFNVGTGIPCDFNASGTCDVFDINLMYSKGNLVTGVPAADAELFDLNGDDVINGDDVDEWLSVAATHNGYSTAYRSGDTDNVGAIFPAKRTVDITDFNTLATNFNPSGTSNQNSVLWQLGNFDGDIDITDFNLLAGHFAPTGYAGIVDAEAVPEPTAGILIALAVLVRMICTRQIRND